MVRGKEAQWLFYQLSCQIGHWLLDADLIGRAGSRFTVKDSSCGINEPDRLVMNQRVSENSHKTSPFGHVLMQI